MYGYGDSRSDEKCSHRNHYDTKAEAKQAAKRMGLEGAHRMSCGGTTVYMPGGSHAEYMDYSESGPVDKNLFGI